jgi:hypothetical protein
MTSQDLKKLIKKVRTLRDQGLSFEKIAMALNEKGFTNLEGEAWKRGAVERFYKRRVQETIETARTPAAKGTKAQSPQPSTEAEVIASPLPAPDGLSQVVTDLKDILAWWRSRKETTRPQTAMEPIKLAGPKKGATISVNHHLLGMLKDQSSASGDKSSAALSGLVEYLLWRHLGSPTHDDRGTPLVLQAPKSKKAAKA